MGYMIQYTPDNTLTKPANATVKGGIDLASHTIDNLIEKTTSTIREIMPGSLSN